MFARWVQLDVILWFLDEGYVFCHLSDTIRDPRRHYLKRRRVHWAGGHCLSGLLCLLPNWLGLVNDVVHRSVCGGHVGCLAGRERGFAREGWFLRGAVDEAGGKAGCEWRIWYSSRAAWLSTGHVQSCGLNIGTAGLVKLWMDGERIQHMT